MPRSAACRTLFLGFTLIELLLVMTIVGLLIGLAVPVVSSVRRSMDMTRCAANLHQIGQALSIYVSVNRAWPPQCATAAPFNPPPPYPQTPLLYDVLARELRPDSPVYRCPADVRVWPQTAAASPHGFGQSYNYVDWDQLVAAYPHNGLSAAEVRNWPVVTDFALGSKYWMVIGAHAGSVNRLHKDGSVDFFTPYK